MNFNVLSTARGHVRAKRETDRHRQTTEIDRHADELIETQTDTDTGSDRDTEAQTEDTNQLFISYCSCRPTHK